MKKVNDMTVFEPTDKCSLDEYSGEIAKEVPELIKKAKEEIKQKVIEISENDIKQDNEILELKTNYTNLQEQNTKLEEKIKKDRENMINLEAEGQSIHIEDSSDLEGQLEVLGNVEQDVREGYNLYDYMSKAISTAKGLNVTKDTENGYLIVNGTPEVSYLSVCNSMEITDILKDKATYTLWQEKYDNKLYLQVVGTKKDGTGNTNFFSASQKTAFTVDKSKYSRYAINIQIGLTTQAGTFNNYKNRYMLYEGTEEKPYEPYGASPSPEYPSTVRAVGDNINLLENTAKTTTVNGVTFTANEDGAVIANGTATSLAQISLVANVKLPAGTYTIKDGKAYVESTEFNDWFDGLNNSSTLTFNTEVLLKNVYIQVKQGETVNNKIFYPKLEKGTVPTTYSKFGQGSVEIKKINKNLAPNLKDGKLEKQSTFICNCKKGESFTLSVKGMAEIDNRLSLRTNVNFAESIDEYVDQETLGLNGTQQKMTITSTIDGILYIRAAANVKRHNIEYLQIENGKVATEIVEHQEQTKILPIQEPMLEGDYFIKEADGWKEVHNWEKKVFDGTENIIKLESDNYNRFVFKLPFTGIPGKAIGNYYKIGNSKYEREFDVDVNGINLLFYSPSKDITTAEQCKDWLKAKKDSGEPLTFFYKIVNHEELPCTPEQTKVLDELDNFQTYKPVTNITTDSIAKLKLKYIADTKTYIDNKTSNLEQQVSVINQLLSTTKTSSVLLDNLQKDIESEVL